MSERERLINDLKSNNSEDMRNKQIAEMARDLHITNDCAEYFMNVLGYRKQSVGKWVFNKEKDEFFCSVCNAEPLIDPHFIGIDYGIEILSDFCPWCGARMKGGAE